MWRCFVANAGRAIADACASDKALKLQIAKRRAQHLVRDVWHQPVELVESPRRLVQPIEADQAPLAADGIQCRCERAPARGRRVAFRVGV